MEEELIFIGERPGNMEVQIKRKPEFHDVICLSNHSPQNTPYQSIPIGTKEQVSIYFTEHNIRLTYGRNSLKIEGNRPISDEEIFNVIQNFAIREGNRVTILTHSLNMPQKQKKLLMMKTSKKMKI